MRQTNTAISQQINFTGKLEEGDGATKFFITKKQSFITKNKKENDYNDAYILVTGNIMVVENIAAQVALKNCAPFILLSVSEKLMEQQ